MTPLTTTDPLESLIAAAPGETRAERVHATAIHLRETSAYCRILLCELSAEAVAGRYWRDLRAICHGGDGYYPTSSAYLRALWGTSYSKSALAARRTLGKAVTAFPTEQRDWLRRQLAELGMARALALATPIRLAEDAAALATWLSRAGDPKVSVDHLRRWIARTYETARTAPRGSNAGRDVCAACGRAWKTSQRRRPAAVLPVKQGALA